MTIKVFLSVGGAANQRQQHFVEAFRQALKSHGVEPVTVGQTDYSHKAPLAAVKEKLAECDGIALLALVRYQAPSLIVKPGGPNESVRSNVQFPTMWNHMEGSMGYVMGLPMLVVAEDGLMPDGLLEQYDWHLFRTELNPVELTEPAMAGGIASWAAEVKSRAELDGRSRASRNARDLTLAELFSSMPIPQLWAIALAMATLLGGAIAIGRLIP